MKEKWYISHYHQNLLNHTRHNGLLYYIKMIGNVLYLKLDLYYIDPHGADRRPSEDWGPSLVSISPYLHPWWDFYLAWGRDLFDWNVDRPRDSLLLLPPSTTATINLRKFLCLHTGQHNSHESLALTMQLEWNDVSPPPSAHRLDSANQALQ